MMMGEEDMRAPSQFGGEKKRAAWRCDIMSVMWRESLRGELSSCGMI